MNLMNFHQVAHRLYQMRIPLFPKIIYYIQFLLFNSSLPPSVKIGKNSVFGYGGIGVVIHDRAQIGERCVLGQGITIGGRSKRFEVPIIGNNVFIGPGARILGDVVIGNNVIIGANSVVIESVPENSIVVGIPAKIIKTDIIPEDYV